MAESRFTQTLPRAGAGSLLAGLMLTLTASYAQEPEGGPAPKKYRLHNLAAAGDARSVDDLMDMQLDMVLTLEGQEVPMKFAMRTRETFTEEVLAVKENSALLRRRYTALREAETGPDGQTKVKVSSLQGKTVTIRVNGRKVTVTADKGKLAPADVKQLQEKLTAGDDATKLVPDRDLAPGEEWTLTPEVVAKIFKGMEKGEVKGRFERVFDEAGRSLAEFQFTLSLQGSPGGSPVPITMTGTGATFYDLKLKRELGGRFGGPVSLEGDVEQEGRKLRIVGSGLLDARQSIRWLKVAGKPVNAPAYPPPGAPANPAPNRQAGL